MGAVWKERDTPTVVDATFVPRAIYSPGQPAATSDVGLNPHIAVDNRSWYTTMTIMSTVLYAVGPVAYNGMPWFLLGSRWASMAVSCSIFKTHGHFANGD